MDRRQYNCRFDGCDKSFLRKEHLQRHERVTHNPTALHVCRVCQKQFNRSDSLLRHLSLHGETQRAPSGRSKKACLNCRAGKIKCDGNEKCAGCIKRGMDCHYRQQSGDVPGGTFIMENQHQMIPESQITDKSHTSNSGATSQVGLPVIALEQPSNSPLVSTTTIDVSGSTAAKPTGVINWGSIRLQKDPENPFENDPVSEQFVELYFEYFHHHFPIVHRAAYVAEDDALSVNLAIKMIGAWLSGTTDSRKYALDVFAKLTTETQSRLCEVTFQDQFQQSLSSGICETALLCIVFGLYYGEAKSLARVSILRSILISCLRAVGFFSPETAWVDERPGYFVPLHLVKLGSRQRLAAYLLKVDAYLSIIQGQPAVLTLEELHFPIPSTFSLFNSNGLPIFEQRLSVEPNFRSQLSLFDMLQKVNSDSPNQLVDPLIIEDIHICICSMETSIWMLSDPTCSSKDCDIGVVLQKDSMRRRLDALKHRLDQFSKQDAYENEIFERYYSGWEENWHNAAVNRIKSLTFDANILYHLFSLHLQADIGSLTHLAKNQNLSNVEKQSERHGQLRERRKISAISWARNATARQALCHAVDILVEVQRNSNKAITPALYNPIAYTAISTAALIAWAYCRFGGDGCETCVPGACPGGHAIELTKLGTQENQSHKDKETWIESGGGFRAQIQGIQLCRCATGFLTALFRDQLPGEWGIADLIAPGVFNNS